MATPRQVLSITGTEYLERNNRLMFCCPFHDDTDPSAGFYEDTELAHCFSCGYTLDPVAFYAAFNHGLESYKPHYQEAERDLEIKFGERKVPNAQINKTKNILERGRAEKELAHSSI